MSDDGYLDGDAEKAMSWSVIASFFRGIYSFASKFLWALIVVLVLRALIQGVTDNSTVIGLISVPKSLSRDGYTSEVAARRLHDAMLTFVDDVNSRMKSPDVVLHGDLPDIVVPSVGISLDAVISTIRSLFRVTQSPTIAGEITIKDKQLWLRLRLDGRELYASPRGVAPNNPDDLFTNATRQIFERIRPYFAALSKIRDDRAHELEIVNGYIDRLPEKDANVSWLYNLEGDIYKRKNDYVAAISAFKMAYTLNPSFATPHNNLGEILRQQRDIDGAIAEYQTAIKIDPQYAFAHKNLGLMLEQQGKSDEAIEEYHKAIDSDPQYAEPHSRLAAILRAQHKTDMAMAQYRKAIALNSHYADPHYRLGEMLNEQKKTDQATEEFRQAITIDPTYAIPFYYRGIILKTQGKTYDAISAFFKTSVTDPNYPSAQQEIRAIIGQFL